MTPTFTVWAPLKQERAQQIDTKSISNKNVSRKDIKLGKNEGERLEDILLLDGMRVRERESTVHPQLHN